MSYIHSSTGKRPDLQRTPWWEHSLQGAKSKFETPTVVESSIREIAEDHIQDDTVLKPLDTPVGQTPIVTTTTHCTAKFITADLIMNKSIVAVMSSMEQMSASYDLPHVEVKTFDGSPEKYPAFRRRFKQSVEARPLSDTIKMTLVLQFLSCPDCSAAI